MTVMGGPVALRSFVYTHQPCGSWPDSNTRPLIVPVRSVMTPPGLCVVGAFVGVEVAFRVNDPLSKIFLESL